MPHHKLIRILNYVWLLVAFPLAVALLVGVSAHSLSFGIKTFLLIECGMVVLIPLFNAVIGDGDHSRHKREKGVRSQESEVRIQESVRGPYDR